MCYAFNTYRYKTCLKNNFEFLDVSNDNYNSFLGREINNYPQENKSQTRKLNGVWNVWTAYKSFFSPNV